ncbi:4-hydroxyphenylpyruvate dioxygenase [Candidatus Paracaedibacter symbiosus]|uniref:4-hydroxyphenylpyruvate dioxygenase n=1 Tax=Candidatus Paracaedibacter symbiosus TaxID=244582 RepID=UPI00068C81EF|nr:4-hydroxyphenylpyruvate dioxygenase [Candidatus Paracaedibacter symbiosus]
MRHSTFVANGQDHAELENPMATDGFEFVEYTSPNEGDLEDLFSRMGFVPIAKHRSKQVTLYRQGDINFLINREPGTYASYYAAEHGPSACAMAFRVADAKFAHMRALSLGAKSAETPVNEGELHIPALSGIGESFLFLVDQYRGRTIYDTDFDYFPGVDLNPKGFGLTYIDHLTHNVYQGRMDIWADFYEKLFNFRQQRYFNITGQKTGLFSRAMISPCGKIRIPINESADDKSQIAEYLNEYKGEGIQHIALGSDTIADSVEQLSLHKIPFMTVPASYYQVVEERLPHHGQDMARLAKNQILMDGEVIDKKVDLLLQIFTNTVIGPIFFEIIQRLGHQGFGEGNFSALFEAMERDQETRGVI